MKKLFNQTLLLSTAALFLFVLSSCAEKAAPDASVQQEETETDTELGEPEESAVEEPVVEELSAEDLALVEEQMFCPVGGKLGGMGTPIKVMVEGKPVFICCEHCREPLLEDPAKHLAALEKKQQAAAAPAEEAPAEEAPAEEAPAEEAPAEEAPAEEAPADNKDS